MAYNRRETMEWQEVFYRVGLTIGLLKLEFLEVKLFVRTLFC